MDKQTGIRGLKPAVVIVGAGPSGASLAIRLANSGFDVCLIEREKFPREKLCGEFISPECLPHFQDLGVLDDMLTAGGERIAETVFYAMSGKSVAVPSQWLGNSAGALGLSRAQMDFRLLKKAKSCGVRVLEETQVIGLLLENKTICGVKARDKAGESFELAADLTIDATGRANVLAKLAKKSKVPALPIDAIGGRKPTAESPDRLVGFKTHLENVDLKRSRCEIYFFRGGYGGLSFIENNRANHCFLVKADLVKKYIGQTELLVEEVIFENRRACDAMRGAKPLFDYLAVTIDGFGLKDLNPAKNLYAVGDAAAFIDPFTGSGMLMALESAEILALSIENHCRAAEKIAENYELLYAEKFRRRLWVCSLMRRAAFMPQLAGTLISALGLSRLAREFLARATRQSKTQRNDGL